MIRELDRDRPTMGLTIWTPPDSPREGEAIGDIYIEWRGRIGHPSEYGLLGGELRVGATQIDVPSVAEPTNRPRVSGSDVVSFALAPEYRSAITLAVPTGLLITSAAQGEISSSRAVFGALARLLLALLKTGTDSDENTIWSQFDSAFAPLRHG